MSKRSHTQLESSFDSDDHPSHKSRSSTVRTLSVSDDMGEFEDAWEDEIEFPNNPDGPFAPQKSV